MTITPIRIDTFKHLTLDSSSIPSIALYSVLDFSSYSRIPFHFSSHEAGKKRESMKIIEEAKNSSLIAKEVSESGGSQGIFDLRELNFFEARVNRISIEELKIKTFRKSFLGSSVGHVSGQGVVGGVSTRGRQIDAWRVGEKQRSNLARGFRAYR